MDGLELKFHDILKLPIDNHGLTLNSQVVDLMMISSSNNFNELKDALSNITNIIIPINTYNLNDSQFTTFRQKVFDFYMDSLISKEDYNNNNYAEFARKISYLKGSGVLSFEDANILDNIIASSNGDYLKISNSINEQFGDKSTEIYKVMKSNDPVEKTGVKQKGNSFLLESYRNLYNYINSYNCNSITIDGEAKYRDIVLPNGELDFSGLDRMIEFARSVGCKVRLNALIFYMDCPSYLYDLKVSNKNKDIVKNALAVYVDGITKHIADNYADDVRSIDVFNELLNRFSIDGAYKYRGDIEQNNNLYTDFDNIKSGWLKHLDINDLCDVVAIAKNNLPNCDFMYNEDNLEDLRKVDSTMQVLSAIHDYENKCGIKLVDSIGTQMHIDNNITKNDVRNMLFELSKAGLPIEVTEFDMAMIYGVDGLDDTSIEMLRQEKIDEIYEAIVDSKDYCNLRGFTAWSLTDKQNFRVELENERLALEGKKPISSLHGGVLTFDMISKTRNLMNSQVYDSMVGITNKSQNLVIDYKYSHDGTNVNNDYVDEMRMKSITQLGFSNYSPVNNYEYPDFESRLPIYEINKYIDSVKKIKTDNLDMNIISGLDVNYDECDKENVCLLHSKVDYMCLDGIKCKFDSSVTYPIKYADKICEAMSTGIFDIVVNPDRFTKYSTHFSGKEKYEFDDNCKKAMEKICELSSELSIPFEIVNKEGYTASRYLYDAASDNNVKILCGSDIRTLGTNKSNIITDSYNPVDVRNRNTKLKELFENTQKNVSTYEMIMISNIMNGVMKQVPDELDIVDKTTCINQLLDKYSELFKKEADAQDGKMVASIQRISMDSNLSIQEKAAKLNNLKKLTGYNNSVLSNRLSLVSEAKSNVVEAIDYGFKSNSEITDIVCKLTELNHTKNNAKKDEIDKYLDDVKKQVVKPKNKVKERTRKKRKTNIQEGIKGFANSFSVTLLTTFGIGALVGIGIMISLLFAVK